MKFTKIAFIVLLFPIIAFSQNSFIGKPIRFAYVEVAQFDIPKHCSYDEAIRISKKLGNGWRLPTRGELKKIYEKRDEIKGFEWGEFYMTDEVYGKTQIYCIDFSDGKELIAPRFYDGKALNGKVRLIRNIKASNPK
jgi:hypothetical protein